MKFEWWFFPSIYVVLFCSILNITESVGGRIVGYEDSATLVAPAIAISVVDISRGQFSSLTFGVSSDRAGRKPEVSKLTIKALLSASTGSL